MGKIEGLPQGAIASVAEEMGVSRSLVEKVAAGERQNVRIEEALWRCVYSHEARMARIRRIKKKMEEYRFGEIN